MKRLKIYKEVSGAGFSAAEDLLLGSSAVSGDNGGSGTVTFGTPQTITQTPAAYYIVYDIADATDPSHSVSAYLNDNSYLDISSPAQGNSSDFPIEPF